MKLRNIHPKSDFLNAWKSFLDAWKSIDSEATAYRSKSPENTISNTLLVAYVFCLVAISLVLQEYLGNASTFNKIVAFIDKSEHDTILSCLHGTVGWLRPADTTLSRFLLVNDYYDLAVLCYWAFWRILGFFILPVVFMLPHPRLRKMGWGLSLKGFFKHLWIYVILFTIVMIPVIYVSTLKEFTSYYPFYREAHRSVFDFVVWESFYVAQFFSLEFFFRGFMLQPLKRIMGSSAIFAMMLPYVMIHIGKPMMECFGAIVAGIVLGFLAIRTRSIWGGFLIHVCIALSMDILAIWRVHWN